MNNRFVNGGRSEFQDANRSPIFGYQHLPIVSLEQAMEKIISIVSEVKQYVPLAKQNCNRNSSILTWDESAAIYLYSMPMPFFIRLNEFLRAEDRNALKPWFAFLKLFITALEKLPACDIVVWRGVVGDVGSALIDNNMQIWWSVNSCSKALNVVELYLGETGTVFAVDASNGKDISEFSVFQQEQEVILMPGSRFRVKSKSLSFRNSLFIIHLEEEFKYVGNKHGTDRKLIDFKSIYSFRFVNACHPKAHHLFQSIAEIRHRYSGWYQYKGKDISDIIDKYLNIERVMANHYPHQTKLFINQKYDRLDIKFNFHSLNEPITITFEPEYPANGEID